MLRFFAALAILGALSVSASAIAAPPPVEAYGKLPAVEKVSLSPSGQRYAFIAVVGESRKLMAATVDGNKPLYAIDVGTAKVVGVDWAGEDHLLVTLSSTVSLGPDFNVLKAELHSVLSINVMTRKVFAIFEKQDDVANLVEGTYGAVQTNGRWYGYFGGVTYFRSATGEYSFDHGWADLYRVDLDTGAKDVVAHGSEDTDGWLVGPDGAIIARAMHDEKLGSWRVLTGAFGGKLLASGTDKLASVGALSRGRGPDTIVINRPTDQGSIYQELKLSGESLGKTTEDQPVEAIIVDPVTQLWIGTVARSDQFEPTFFDPTSQAKARGTLKAFPGESVRLASFTSDLNRLIVETSGTGDSGTYWLVDIKTGDADQIGYEYPDAKPSDVGTIEMVDWKAADGLALRGVLNLPPGRDPKNLPLIVMPHGGPEDRDYPAFDWWAQLFASRGYAVFQPNFRGSSGYGVAFRDAGFGQMGRKMETDVSDGVVALAKQGIVDPNRACIVGWSYGGYAAQAGITLQHGLYRCAVSMAGVSDLGRFLAYVRQEVGDDSEGVRYWTKFMGATSLFETELNAISPAKQAAQADAPILLIHGKDDTVVPIEQSQEMERALKAAGKPVEFITLSGADHWLLHEDTRLAMAKASIDFVLKYNPPDPEPAVTGR